MFSNTKKSRACYSLEASQHRRNKFFQPLWDLLEETVAPDLGLPDLRGFVAFAWPALRGAAVEIVAEVSCVVVPLK